VDDKSHAVGSFFRGRNVLTTFPLFSMVSTQVGLIRGFLPRHEQIEALLVSLRR
jgi:hypothetical protein